MPFNLVGSLVNTALQYSNLKYQKKLQGDMFEREDNSIQRRVADLKAAGMSPVLAAGQGASAGPTIATQAPQIEQNRLAENVMQLIQMKQNIAQSDSQIELNKANAIKSDADTQKAMVEAKRAAADTRKINMEAGIRAQELADYGKTGVGPNASTIGKVFKDTVNVLDKSFEQSVILRKLNQGKNWYQENMNKAGRKVESWFK